MKPVHPPCSLNSSLAIMSWLSSHPSSHPQYPSFYLCSPQHYYHHCQKCCNSQSPLQERKMYAKNQCASGHLLDALNYTSPLSSWSWEQIWSSESRCQLCSHVKQRESESELGWHACRITHRMRWCEGWPTAGQLGSQDESSVIWGGASCCSGWWLAKKFPHFLLQPLHAGGLVNKLWTRPLMICTHDCDVYSCKPNPLWKTSITSHTVIHIKLFVSRKNMFDVDTSKHLNPTQCLGVFKCNMQYSFVIFFWNVPKTQQ